MEEEKIEISSSENITTKKKEGGFWKSFFELLRFTIIAIAIVVPIRVFIAQPFIVSGSSMVPTFEDGQYLIIDEISYRLDEPKRDDVVVFRYPNDPEKFFIKRIIGLPNETVHIENETIKIFNEEHKDGLVLDQGYLKNNTENDKFHKTLDKDEYFMLGDNRSASSDSRVWGAVQKDLLIGRVFLRLLPIDKIGIWPGRYTQVE